MDDPRARRRRWLSLLVGAIRHPHRRAGGRRRPDLFPRRGRGAAPGDRRRGTGWSSTLPDGKLELLREDIVKRVPGFWPADEWEARRREAQGAGIRGAIRGGLVGDRERPDDGGGRRGARAARDRPEARPDGTDGRRAGPARPALPRPGFRGLPRGAGDRGQDRARAARPAAAPAQRRRGRGAGRGPGTGDRGVPPALRRPGGGAAGPAPPPGLGVVRATGRITWRSCTGRAPTRSRRPAAISTRPGTRWSPSTRGAARSSVRRGGPWRRVGTSCGDRRACSIRCRRGRGLRLKLGDEPARAVGRAEGRALIERLEREVAYRTALLDLDWRIERPGPGGPRDGPSTGRPTAAWCRGTTRSPTGCTRDSRRSSS